MSRHSPDDQLKFLLSCVKHSNNGKIDFIEVAQECGVVSKGAAAKRYERLMKANGINPNGGPDPKPMTVVNTLKGSKSSSKDKEAKPAAKRRKVERAPMKRPEEGISTANSKAQMPLDRKADKVNSMPPTTSDTALPALSGIHDESVGCGSGNSNEASFDFNEFCSPEAFDHCDGDRGLLSQQNMKALALVTTKTTAIAAPSVAHSSIPWKPPPANIVRNEKRPGKERETVIIAD